MICSIFSKRGMNGDIGCERGHFVETGSKIQIIFVTSHNTLSSMCLLIWGPQITTCGTNLACSPFWKAYKLTMVFTV